MTTDPGEPSTAAAARPTRTTRCVRRVARTVLVVDFVVLMVVLFRLGFVDINDHPGLVITIWIAVPIFVVAFPFVQFRKTGGQEPCQKRQDHQ